MTEYELSYLISESISYMGDVFEFWLTFSFAAIVATSYASDKLNVSYVKLMCLGYLSTSAFLLLARINSIAQISDLLSKMEQAGYDTSRFESGISVTTGMLGLALYILGSCGILFYMVKTYKGMSKVDA